MSCINMRKFFRITVIGAMMFALLLLSGCLGSATDKKTDSSNKGGGEFDNYDGDPSYVTEVSDVKYDGNGFLYIFGASIENDVRLLSYVTIDGVDYPLADSRIGAQKLTEEEINVGHFCCSEIYDTTVDKFSITAYTESLDGTKRGKELTVEFLNYAIHPTLDTETGVITWKNHPVYSEFKIYAWFTSWGPPDYEKKTTEARFDTAAFPEKYKNKPADIRIEAIVNKDAEYSKIYYTPNNKYAHTSAVKHSLSSLNFNNNVISWYCNDNRFFTTKHDGIFDLVITDGDEVIEKTLTFAYGESPNYTYVPKTDNFFVSVSGGVDDPRFITAEPITLRPICAGYLDNIRVVGEYVCWDNVKAVNDKGVAYVDDGLVSYNVYQDGEFVKNITEKRIKYSDMKELYGETEIVVSTNVTEANYYFCSDESISIFYGKEPTLTCEKIDEHSARILISDVDENATSYVLYSDSHFVTDFTLELDNTGDVISYVFTPEEEGSYYIYAYPVYENSNSIAVRNEHSVSVELVKRVHFDKVKFENDRWYIKFECGEYETYTQIEYSIIADDEQYNSEDVMYLSEWLKLPSCLVYSDSTKVTIKVKRYTRFTPTERSVELFGEECEFPLVVLPDPSDMKTDGNNLLWSYDTDMPYTKFGVDILYFDYTTFEYKTAYHKKTMEKSLNLFDVEVATGDNQMACVYAIADNSNYVEGGNIYLDSSHWQNLNFDRLSAPKVYAEGTEKIVFSVNDADASNKNLIESPEAIAVTIWAYDSESGEKVSYSTTVGHGGELSVLSYFTKWGVDEIYIDVQVRNTTGYYINGPQKTYTVLTPKMTGFKISNENGTLSWDNYLKGTTYDYTLFVGGENPTLYEVTSEKGISDSSVNIKTPLWNFASENVDKTFDSIMVRIMPNIDPALQTPTGDDTTLILAPSEAFEFEFSALSYTLKKLEGSAISISFNKEFEAVPTVTAKTTLGASIGTQSSDEAYFSFDSLAVGKHTLIFTCNVASGVLDGLNTFNIPYYHSLTVNEKPKANGVFENFSSGEYYLEPIGSMAGGYRINSSKSTSATVDFYLTSGSELYFNGSKVDADKGVYTLDLLISNSIQVRTKASKGLSLNMHSYTKADYDFYTTFTFDAKLPVMVESCYVRNGKLYLETSSYSKYAFVTVLRNGTGLEGDLTLTKGTNAGLLTYDPTNNGGPFEAGDVVMVVIRLIEPNVTSEAYYVLEVTAQ